MATNKSRKPTLADTRKADKKRFFDDLAKSNITEKDAEKFGVYYADRDAAEAITEYHAPVALFQYFDVAGEEIPFFRAKFLTKPTKTAFGDVELPGKYIQPTGTQSRFYFPKTRDWQTIATDIKTPIIITEGEKKTICATKHGLVCIGIGGVAAWKSTKQFNQRLAQDFEAIQWRGRTVYLSFDADVATNPMVTKQLNDLSSELSRRGVKSVKVISLPHDTPLGKKCGLDDYINEFGIDAYKDLIDTAQDLIYEKALWELNERYAYIEKMGDAYDFEFEQFIPKRHFYDNTAHYKVIELKLVQRKDEDPTLKHEEVDANDMWWKWANRRTYANVDYLPGQPRMLNDGTLLNTWKGFPQEPQLGEIQPFVDLFDHVTAELTDTQKKWLWQWLAWPIKHPRDGKIHSAIMVHSKTEGSGKSFLGELMCGLYGENSHTLNGPDEVFSTDNGWVEDKQFIAADEVLVGTRRETDRIKNFVTAKTHNINRKYIAPYTRTAWMNWYLTSNHDDALKLLDQDRRWFVIHAQEKKLTQRMTESLRRWRRNGGLAHLHYHLLKDVDCQGFKPYAPPPTTLAKSNMVEAAKSDVELWVEQLWDDPLSIMSMGQVANKNCLFQWNEFYENFVPAHFGSKAVINAMTRAGFEMRRISANAHFGKGATKKIWCIGTHEQRTKYRNYDKTRWAKDFAAHLRKTNRYVGESKLS